MELGSVVMILAGSLMAAPPSPGISESLARDRAASIHNLRYQLTLSIPEHKAEPIFGTEIVRFTLRAPAEVVLDFAQPRDHVRTVSTESAFVNGHIVIPASSTHAGENSITIEFIAGD